MSKVLALAISTICIYPVIANIDTKTVLVSKNPTTSAVRTKTNISEYLSSTMDSNEQARYKYLFDTSVNGDLKSLKELIGFDCGGGSHCYGHGILIFKVAEQIGEEPFIKIIHSMSKRERLWLKALLDIGLEYADFDRKHEYTTLHHKFPKISTSIYLMTLF